MYGMNESVQKIVEVESCSICTEEFKIKEVSKDKMVLDKDDMDPEDLYTLPCGHFFHAHCIFGWLLETCPNAAHYGSDANYDHFEFLNCPLCRGKKSINFIPLIAQCEKWWAKQNFLMRLESLLVLPHDAFHKTVNEDKEKIIIRFCKLDASAQKRFLSRFTCDKRIAFFKVLWFKDGKEPTNAWILKTLEEYDGGSFLQPEDRFFLLAEDKRLDYFVSLDNALQMKILLCGYEKVSDLLLCSCLKVVCEKQRTWSGDLDLPIVLKVVWKRFDQKVAEELFISAFKTADPSRQGWYIETFWDLLGNELSLSLIEKFFANSSNTFNDKEWQLFSLWDKLPEKMRQGQFALLFGESVYDRPALVKKFWDKIEEKVRAPYISKMLSEGSFYWKEKALCELADKFSSSQLVLYIKDLLKSLKSADCFDGLALLKELGLKLDKKTCTEFFTACLEKVDYFWHGDGDKVRDCLEVLWNNLENEPRMVAIEKILSWYILGRFWLKFTSNEQLAWLKQIWKKEADDHYFSSGTEDVLAKLDQNQVQEIVPFILESTPHKSIFVLEKLWGKLSESQQFAYSKDVWLARSKSKLGCKYKPEEFLGLMVLFNDERRASFVDFVLKGEAKLIQKAVILNAFGNRAGKSFCNQIKAYGQELLKYFDIAHVHERIEAYKRFTYYTQEVLCKTIAEKRLDSGSFGERLLFLGMLKKDQGISAWLRFFNRTFDHSDSKDKCQLVELYWKNLPKKDIRPFYLQRIKNECVPLDVQEYKTVLRLGE